MTANIETELKLVADPAAIEAIMADAGLFDGASTTKQLSTYFDTEARALHSAGLSLRVRASGGRRVQTVKGERPGTPFARDEWEREIAGDVPETADAEAALGQALPGPVAPLFRTEVARTKVIAREGAARIELVADRGHIVAGSAVALIGEVELELMEGDPRALFALARRVVAVAPVRLGVQSKSERGYLLASGKRPHAVKAEPLRLMPEMDAADLFAAVATTCFRHFRLNEDRLLATGAPEPLHQARVALRRFRSALTIFRDMLTGPELDRFRADLRWLAALLGDVRNIDVLIPRIVDAPARIRLEEARAEALARARAALDSVRVRDLMLDLAEWVAFGAWREADDTAALRATPARDYAGAVLDRFRRRLKKRGRHLARLDDEARHEVRIVGKKLRYAAEFFATLYAAKKQVRRRERFLDRLEAMQDALGDLNDLAGAHALLDTLGVAGGERLIEDGERTAPKLLLAAAERAHDAALDEKRFWR